MMQPEQEMVIQRQPVAESKPVQAAPDLEIPAFLRRQIS
jgi:hypothetical protein